MRKKLVAILLIGVLLCTALGVSLTSSSMAWCDPYVCTGTAASITTNSANIMNNSYNYISKVSEAGVQYSTKSNMSGGQFVPAGSPFQSPYPVSLNGLSPDTYYYYRAYVKASGCTYYGTIKCFKTAKTYCAPVVKTGDPIDVTQTTATIINNSYSGITTTIYEVGVNYHLSSNMNGNPWRTGTIGTPFSVYLTGLTPDTTYYYQAYVNVPGGQYRGEIKSFRTPKKAVDCPVVKTGDATNVSQNAANIINNTYSGIYSTIAEVGNQYSTNSGMSGGAYKVGNGIATPFSTSLTGLSADTTYYYRAYVKIGSSYYYGEVKSFKTPNYADCPVVKTGDATNVSQNAANIINNTYSGIYSAIADTGNQYSIYANMSGGSYASGNGIATPFSTSLTGLSANTTYYYRAYVRIGSSYYYGEVKSFKTSNYEDCPVVRTGDPTNITQDAATIINNTYSGIYSAIADTGNQYSIYANMSGSSNASGTSLSTPFSTNLTGLSANTTYYYRAYVRLGSSYYYGEVKSFKTPNYTDCPIVKTGNPTNVTQTSATIVNNTYSGIYSVISETGNQYSAYSNMSSASIAMGAIGTPFSTNLTGLSADTTYYYRAYVKVGGNTYYGEIKTFKTPQDVDCPVVRTGDATNVAASSATIVNNTYSGIFSPITEVGNQYSIYVNMSSSATAAGAIGTPFSTNLTGLFADTTYYYRAYVKVASGNVYYGEIKSFKYSSPVDCPVVRTGDAAIVSQTTATILNNTYSGVYSTIAEVGNQYSINPSMVGSSTATGAIGTPFSTNLAGLTANTTYYFRAYVRVAGGSIYYGEIKSFVTPGYVDCPDVRTGDPSGISFYSADIVNNTYSGIYSAISEVGNEYSISAAMIGALQQPGMIGTPYSTALTLLSPNTTYYYRAYVKVAGGSIYYGSIRSFKTPCPSICPLVYSGNAENVGNNSATIANNIFEGVTSGVTEVGLQYSTQLNLSGGIQTVTGAIGTPYSVNLTGLSANTIYYYRAYIIVGTTIYTGNIKSFSTSTSSSNITVSGSVKWDDATNAYSTRPVAVSVVLKRNGIPFYYTTAEASTQWSFSFTNLPRNDSTNSPYLYTVDETSTPLGYTKAVDDATYTITNTLRSVKLTAIYFNDRGGIEIGRETVYVPYNSSKTLSAPAFGGYTAKSPTSQTFLNVRDDETFWVFHYDPC